MKSVDKSLNLDQPKFNTDFSMLLSASITWNHRLRFIAPRRKLMNAKYPWIFVALFLFAALFLLNARPGYAQDEGEVIATQTFTVRNAVARSASAGDSDNLCTVTAELRWYKNKNVKVMYHWQNCTAAPTIYWELASIQTPSGSLVLNAKAGVETVYYKIWPALKSGDRITLHTWINDAPQADVVTEFKEGSPIWAKLHTRQDSGGACFQFTGHVDPWGVFTAGDKSYVLELGTADWATPWLVGPNERLVDWHVQFYRDAELTQLRNEYWFNKVANPCYSEPPKCDDITLSIPNGSTIPETGADVTVTIIGQNSDQYRIVNVTTGEVVAGPNANPQFNLHVQPDVVYQGQVYREGYDWTNNGCQFQYGKTPRPVCKGVTLNSSTDKLPPTGQPVQVTINGENASQYRVVNTTTGEVVAGPSADAVLTLQALPNVPYQAQVYSETYGWTTTGCQFQYGEVPTPPVCEGVTLNPASGSSIPFDGQQVDVTIHGKNASQYRIVDTQDGTVAAGPSTSNVFSFKARPGIVYQAQLYNERYGWTNEGCTFEYGTLSIVGCNGVTLSIPKDSVIPIAGAELQVSIDAEGAVQYRILDTSTNSVVVGPSANQAFTLHVMPNVLYQAEVQDSDGVWFDAPRCAFSYEPPMPEPRCEQIVLSIPNGAVIPQAGADVEVTVTGVNATQYRLVDNTGATVVEPGPEPTLHFHALPGITYQVQVANDSGVWTTTGCQFGYNKPAEQPTCTGVALSVPAGAVIAASGAEVDVTISGQNATLYQLVDAQGTKMAGPSADPHMHIHAMPDMRYQAQVANADHDWTTTGCDFTYTKEKEVVGQAFCELRASHYGDPGGRSRITAWVKDQTTPVTIEKVRINWNGKGDVTYPTKRQTGPWFTNSQFTLDSRPEVFDVGFGYYKYEAWVYIAGIAEPAYCWGDGNAPDHDNVLPDPGPFAQPNPEGKLDRGNTPSRLPTVGRLPFDGGNGPDKVELILWAFEKEGRGVDAKITASANEGKPLARLGMSSVSSVAKFDGLNAREGIVYGFQIGEHGPWSPLFCPKADNDPTTITVYWAAGGLTWLSDGNAYGDCWWLTVAAALNGWVTVDESVATYNALQPLIDWNGHRNLVFSLAQSRETGLGPRMQDAVIGLQAREWQGPVVPTTVPADFAQTVEAYRTAQAK